MAETERVKENLRALVKKTDVGVKLRSLKNPLGINSTTGVGRRKPKGESGIASPITEPDYSAREFHPERVYYSSDGLFTIHYKPIKKIVMEDEGGNPAEFIYDEPV